MEKEDSPPQASDRALDAGAVRGGRVRCGREPCGIALELAGVRLQGFLRDGLRDVGVRPPGKVKSLVDPVSERD